MKSCGDALIRTASVKLDHFDFTGEVLFGWLSDIIDMTEVLYFVGVENIISALFITVFNKESSGRMELIERSPCVFDFLFAESRG